MALITIPEAVIDLPFVDPFEVRMPLFATGIGTGLAGTGIAWFGPSIKTKLLGGALVLAGIGIAVFSFGSVRQFQPHAIGTPTVRVVATT